MNNNQPRSCKICNRWFPTGKSMGGHMRSHLAKLPLPPKPYIPPPPPPQQQPAGGLLLTSPDPPAPAPSSSPSSTLVNSTEDEDSSFPVMTRTRSVRRKRTLPPPPPPPKQITSSGEEEAEVAMCLLMMSFGRGGGGGKLYRCEKCNRGFGSYQALGGHRASHNKAGRRLVMMDYDDDEEEEEEDDDEYYHHIIDEEDGRVGSNSRRMFKCSICDKEFESGQALGGHKKVHFAEMNKMKKKRRLILSIDLNSPVPDDDDAYRLSR